MWWSRLRTPSYGLQSTPYPFPSLKTTQLNVDAWCIVLMHAVDVRGVDGGRVYTPHTLQLNKSVRVSRSSVEILQSRSRQRMGRRVQLNVSSRRAETRPVCPSVNTLSTPSIQQKQKTNCNFILRKKKDCTTEVYSCLKCGDHNM